MRTDSLVNLGGISLHPSEDRWMVYRKAALTHHLLKIAVAQLVAQVPAHAQEDDLRLKVTPLERGLTLFQDYDPVELWMRWRVDYSQTINSCNTTDLLTYYRAALYGRARKSLWSR